MLLLCFTFISQGQQCVPNSLTNNELLEMDEDVKTYRFLKRTYNNLADVTILKSGPEPDLTTYENEGIWFGKANGIIDSCLITLTFSRPILSLDFTLSHFNNDDASGREEVQNFQVFQKDGKNITDKTKFNWVTGPESGIAESIWGSTSFNPDTRTISAKYMTGAIAGSGRILISGKTPFTKISFRHQDIAGSNSSANGVILGDLNFCVIMPAPVALNDTVTTPLNKLIHIKAAANDRDSNSVVDANSIDLDPSTPQQQFIKKVTGGVFSVDTLGRVVTFTPEEGFSGSSQVHYTINNSYGLHSNPATISVQVGKDITPKTVIHRLSASEVYSDIYFDFDKADIKKEAAQELDKYIVMYKKYPNLILEIRSFSDCRGNSSYNATLSKKRADASAGYLISKGIPAAQLIQKGLGESNNQACDCNSKESTCPEKEYQSNRRTEIKVVSLE